MRDNVPPNNLVSALRCAPALLAWALIVVPASAASPAGEAKLARQLAVVQEESAAAASSTQDQERAIARLERQLGLRKRDAEGTARGLDESRPEQIQLLGALEWL